LAALRIAGAAALGRPVSQLVVPRGAEAHEGQLAIRTGWLGRGRALVSAAVTPASLAALAAPAPGSTGPSGRTRASIDQLGASLSSLTAVAYGRGGAPDATELDAALASGVEVVRRLRFQSLWPMRAAAAVARSVGVY
jgi:hypothetical protein